MRIMVDKKRILWRCRRGMKELDVMLERFVTRELATLNAGEKATLDRLLDARDPDLFRWLTGDESPTDVALKRLVQRIRASQTRAE